LGAVNSDALNLSNLRQDLFQVFFIDIITKVLD